MKSLAAFIFPGLLLVLPAAAQHGGHSGGGHSSGGSGFHGGGGGGYSGSYYRGRPAIVPYARPAFGIGYGYYSAPAYGYGFGDPGYGYGDPGYGYGDPGYAYAAPAPPPPPPAEMYYAPDGQPEPPPPPPSDVPQYQAPAPTPQEQAMSEGRYYLIAYKDHSVYTALAYWMENGVLNYVTPQNAHNQISLDLLDLDYTKQLNARRGLGFNIVGDMRR